jgi:hypothetical protein
MKPIDFIKYFEKGEALLGISRIILRIRRRKNTMENEDAPKREVLTMLLSRTKLLQEFL